MTDWMLIIGCALLAFGPFLSLFGLVFYQKAQLVIVVTSAAFFFLLASLGASFVYFIFDAIGLGGALTAIIPGVFFQFVARCVFVSLYHRVEHVIQLSLEKHHREQQREQAIQGSSHHSPSEPATDDSVRALPRNPAATAGTTTNQEPKLDWAEAARLRLQLNDASCGVAAGVGFGGMHAILLYGTLLASEASHSGGILYQKSCPDMPALVISAIYAFCFTILDVFWMLFTFFGMRRRLLYHRGEHAEHEVLSSGGWLGNSRNGGNKALFLCLITHVAAALLTGANYFAYGCRVSLPAVGCVVLVTAYLFWAGVGRIYMPPNPQLEQLRSSREHGTTNGSGVPHID